MLTQYNKDVFYNLVEALEKILKNNKDELFAMNKNITLDTDYYIEEDYRAINLYLDYLKNNYPVKLIKKIKPKGKILIILSYNEPLIMSIIPVINALIAGNEVILKPSRAAKEFVEAVWKKSGLIGKYNLKLEIVFLKKDKEIESFIEKVIAVYFFGSHRVAQVIAKICGKYYVEFYPHVEASDVKIFNKDLFSSGDDPGATIGEAFTHSGQTCQRIQGVLVQDNFYNDYVEDLKSKFIKLCGSKNIKRYVGDRYASGRIEMLETLSSDIEAAKPDEVIVKRQLPILVINPNVTSDFVKKAYFLPVLWISRFGSKEELAEILNSRRFFLGLNIQSDDNNFIDYLVKNTRFTRYTINSIHTDVGPEEGWGGAWPSGYSGYKSWLEHFSDPYIVFKRGAGKQSSKEPHH